MAPEIVLPCTLPAYIDGLYAKWIVTAELEKYFIAVKHVLRLI
jgi:hypothetical protein